MRFTKSGPAGRAGLDALLRDHAPKNPFHQQAYWRAVTAARRSSLLPAWGRQRRAGPGSAAGVAMSLARMAAGAAGWCRGPETWRSPKGGPAAHAASLAAHLFAAYPVPHFLAAAWWAGPDAEWARGLYRHLGAGHGVRRYELPNGFRLTKPEAAAFHFAPDDVTPSAALRWARVRAAGGGPSLARALAITRPLDAPTNEEPFWAGVVRFLVREEVMPSEAVAMVRFVNDLRFRPGDMVWGPGAGSAPLWPDLDLTGRSLRSLRRFMRRWREELAAARPELADLPRGRRPWPASRFQPMAIADGDATWTVTELLSAEELVVEGGVLRHCVATYISCCARRHTTIWSIKRCHGGVRRRVATVQVSQARGVVIQAKAKANADLPPGADDVLRQWARREGLTLPPRLCG